MSLTTATSTIWTCGDCGTFNRLLVVSSIFLHLCAINTSSPVPPNVISVGIVGKQAEICCRVRVTSQNNRTTKYKHVTNTDQKANKDSTGGCKTRDRWISVSEDVKQ